MDTCIQTSGTVKRDLDNTILTLRLNGAEAARFWRLMDEAKARNAYAGKSDVVRELLGLNPPTVLTENEIHFFRTGEKKAGVLTNSKKGILATDIHLGNAGRKRKTG